MQYTPNHNLAKPEDNDTADIAILNANADKIDAALFAKASKTDVTNHSADETKHMGTATKTTPVDADFVVLVDSVDGSKLKRFSWANAKTTLGAVFAPLTHSHAWSAITGIPASFNPSAHKANHKTGGVDALTPADIGAATSSHIHGASAITQDASNRFVTDAEKAEWNSKAAGTHAHTIANITGLQAALDNSATHTYTATSAGTGAGLTATIPGLTLADGVTVRLKLHAAIAAGATLDLNGTGAKAIVDSKGTAVKAGAVAGAYLTMAYNGTNFIVQGEGGGVKANGTEVSIRVKPGSIISEGDFVEYESVNFPYVEKTESITASAPYIWIKVKDGVFLHAVKNNTVIDIRIYQVLKNISGINLTLKCSTSITPTTIGSYLKASMCTETKGLILMCVGGATNQLYCFTTAADYSSITVGSPLNLVCSSGSGKALSVVGLSDTQAIATITTASGGNDYMTPVQINISGTTLTLGGTSTGLYGEYSGESNEQCNPIKFGNDIAVIVSGYYSSAYLVKFSNYSDTSKTVSIGFTMGAQVLPTYDKGHLLVVSFGQYSTTNYSMITVKKVSIDPSTCTPTVVQTWSTSTTFSSDRTGANVACYVDKDNKLNIITLVSGVRSVVTLDMTAGTFTTKSATSLNNIVTTNFVNTIDVSLTDDFAGFMFPRSSNIFLSVFPDVTQYVKQLSPVLTYCGVAQDSGDGNDVIRVIEPAENPSGTIHSLSQVLTSGLSAKIIPLNPNYNFAYVTIFKWQSNYPYSYTVRINLRTYEVTFRESAAPGGGSFAPTITCTANGIGIPSTGSAYDIQSIVWTK